ncbi:MAG: biopolymer transporter ExbD [Bdellovibrionales bacterium]|nr:biopolymer transporter ExbD [Bdellovibrionales bacterium]
MSRKRRHSEEMGEELNLVPYMDIMVNLVLFMLVNITSFLSFTILNTSIPAIGDGGGDDKSLSARVDVESGSYKFVVTQGADKVLVSSVIPKINNEDGEKVYDTQSLLQAATSAKQKYSMGEQILLNMSAKVKYEDLVATMDAVAETKPGLGDLFIEPTLNILWGS